MTTLPFEGLRVLNFGTAAVAPLTARFFVDYGAEVIKIETKARLDILRLAGGKMAEGLAPEDTIEASSVFIELNRGSKSIQGNLKNPKAIELIKKLVKISDIVVENFAPRVMTGLGLGYEELKKVKPDLIMVSLSAVGQTGPMRDIKTYGPTIAAICGKQSMMGYQDGEPVHDYASPDYNGAIQAGFLAMGALYHRMKTGKGQHIDIGQAAPALYLYGEPLMDLTMNGVDTHMMGNWRRGYAPHNTYRCKPDYFADGLSEEQWVTIAVETDEEWKSLCEVMGNPPWAKDAKYSDYSGRWENQAELDKLIGEWTINLAAYEVTFKLQEAGVAAMPAMDEEKRTYDPHLRAKDTFKYLDSVKVPKIAQTRGTLGLGDTPEVWKTLSALGTDNEYVYGELLGLSKEEIIALQEEKAIF